MAYKRKKKNYFFTSIYMKMTLTFNYLEVMRRIIQSPERKKEREREKRKKENKKYFFHLFFLLYVYMKMS